MRILSRKSSIGVLLAFASFWPSLLAVAAGNSTQEGQIGLAKVYRLGLWSNHESLKRGEVNVQCKVTSPSSADGASFGIYLCCDFVEGKVRFDRTVRNQGTSQFIRTRQDVYVLMPGRGVIAKHAPDYEGSHLVETQAFDPRVLGITQYGEWDIVDYKTMRSFLDKNLTSFERDASGKGVLTWDYDFGPPAPRGQMKARRIIVVDKEKGYSPVSMEEYFRWPDENYGSPAFSTSVEHKKINGTWVPVRCILEDHRERSVRKTDVQLDWISVNAPLDESVFMPSGLNAPGGTLIASMKLGREGGIVEDMLPRGGIDDLPGGPLSITHSEELTTGHNKWILIGVNVVVVVILIGFLLAKKLRLGH